MLQSLPVVSSPIPSFNMHPVACSCITRLAVSTVKLVQIDRETDRNK